MRSTKNIEKRIKNVNIVVDSERNKKVFSNILQAFEKSKAKELAPSRPNIWKTISRSPIAKLAAAVVIIVAFGLFLGQDWNKPINPTASPPPAAQSPVKKTSLISLRTAYHSGGFEALDQQLRDTLDMLGPQSLSISMQELLEGLN